uniref:HTH CENPB-type domain-containing protein n=1 Tax=Glossina brevipalpis TaxID=37001 RepID=A0A1A9W8G6_9MUSC
MPKEKEGTSSKRKFITIETKIQILERFQNQERLGDIARHFKLNESTIRTIKENEEKIRCSLSSRSSVLAKIISRPRAKIMEKMEQSLTKKRLPLDGNAFKQKALKIFNYLKEGQPSIDEDNHQFVVSKGWFEKFKKRHSLHSSKIQGERASADAEAADKYSEEFAKIIKEYDYLPDQIFNADETGLWWKKMPSRTFISKNEKTAPGFKVSKDRITLLLYSNASGNFITTPFEKENSKLWITMSVKREIANEEFASRRGTSNAELHAHSTRSRDAIKECRQRRSYISLVESLRAAVPPPSSSNNLDSVNFSITESQELVKTIESLKLNDGDAILRDTILSSSESGKAALAKWIINRLTSYISKGQRRPRRTNDSPTTNTTNSRARRAVLYRCAH